MCRCTPEMRTPFCGRPGCAWPAQPKREAVPIVRQLETFGCSIACLAAVLGVTYEAVRAEIGEPGRGLTHFVWHEYLSRHGYAVQFFFQTDGFTHVPRDPWPLAPWVDVHMCGVDAGGPGGHCVVLLRDGMVMDPAADQYRRLSDYRSVFHMTGLFKVGA